MINLTPSTTTAAPNMLARTDTPQPDQTQPAAIIAMPTLYSIEKETAQSSTSAAPLTPRSELRAAALSGDGNAVKRLLAGSKPELSAGDPGSGLTALMLAARAGHDDVVVLLTKGRPPQDIHRQSPQGDTALSLAAASGHADVVLLLLAKEAAIDSLIDAGAAIEQVDEDGDAALILASRNGHLDAVQTLLGRGAKTSLRNHENKDALGVALYNDQYPVAKLLYAAGVSKPAQGFGVRVSASAFSKSASVRNTASAFVFDVTGQIAPKSNPAVGAMTLFDAVVSNDAIAVARMLMVIEQNGNLAAGELDQLHEMDDDDAGTSRRIRVTPLMAAARYGRCEVLGLLVFAGATLQVLSSSDMTALMFAAKHGHTDAVGRLLMSNGDVNYAKSHCKDALMWAAQNGHTATVSALLKAGARLDSSRFELMPVYPTALMWAALNGQRDTVELLLKEGASVDATGSLGATALIWAAQGGHTSVVQALLKAGAEVDHASRVGGTALIWAALNGHAATVQALSDAAANVNRVGYRGMTALMSAAFLGDSATVQVLLHAGADCNLQTSSCETAMSLAMDGKHEDVIKLLVEHATLTERLGTPLPRRVGARRAISSNTSPIKSPNW